MSSGTIVVEYFLYKYLVIFLHKILLLPWLYDIISLPEKLHNFHSIWSFHVIFYEILPVFCLGLRLTLNFIDYSSIWLILNITCTSIVLHM